MMDKSYVQSFRKKRKTKTPSADRLKKFLDEPFGTDSFGFSSIRQPKLVTTWGGHQVRESSTERFDSTFERTSTIRPTGFTRNGLVVEMETGEGRYPLHYQETPSSEVDVLLSSTQKDTQRIKQMRSEQENKVEESGQSKQVVMVKPERFDTFLLKGPEFELSGRMGEETNRAISSGCLVRPEDRRTLMNQDRNERDLFLLERKARAEEGKLRSTVEHVYLGRREVLGGRVAISLPETDKKSREEGEKTNKLGPTRKFVRSNRSPAPSFQPGTFQTLPTAKVHREAERSRGEFSTKLSQSSVCFSTSESERRPVDSRRTEWLVAQERRGRNVNLITHTALD